MKDLGDYRKAARKIKKDAAVLFFIKRGESSVYISFRVKEK